MFNAQLILFLWFSLHSICQHSLPLFHKCYVIMVVWSLFSQVLDFIFYWQFHIYSLPTITVRAMQIWMTLSNYFCMGLRSIPFSMGTCQQLCKFYWLKSDSVLSFTLLGHFVTHARLSCNLGIAGDVFLRAGSGHFDICSLQDMRKPQCQSLNLKNKRVYKWFRTPWTGPCQKPAE